MKKIEKKPICSWCVRKFPDFLTKKCFPELGIIIKI